MDTPPLKLSGKLISRQRGLTYNDLAVVYNVNALSKLLLYLRVFTRSNESAVEVVNLYVRLSSHSFNIFNTYSRVNGVSQSVSLS